MAEKIEFVIEKGVPRPTPRSPDRSLRKQALRRALLAMEVGDSVFVPGCQTSSEAAGMAGGWKSYYPDIFTSRVVEGGCRIWRIG